METFYDATPGLLKKSAIALGFFDGVHPGHRAVIGNAVQEAKKIGATAGVVTFRDHPRALTRGSSPLLLTVIEQRLELFADMGVEAALVLSFTEDLCRLSPREYVETILVKGMGARSISVGYNHHFGRDREGNPDLLRELGGEFGFDVHVAPMIFVDGQEVSSSRIREMVSVCAVDGAAKLLSRPYSIVGQVVRGDGRGRKLGFPTANLTLCEFQLIPGRGVYAGFTRLADRRRLPCVINVGLRPTFSGSPGSSVPAGSDAPGGSGTSSRSSRSAGTGTTVGSGGMLASGKSGGSGGASASGSGQTLLVEVHILDFDEDLYDTTMQVEFSDHLRPEQKFAGIDALKSQITSDCNVARELLARSKPRLPA